MTALKNGKSVDTSLDFTPFEGLVMSTRSGDIDPAIHYYLTKNSDMDIEAVDNMLNKESGLRGLCEMNDMREIHEQIAGGNERARLALEVQTYRNRRYIGAYMAVLGRVDAIVFTAGIGENDKVVREKTLAGDSPVQVWVIPTNEELAIGRDEKSLLEKEE